MTSNPSSNENELVVEGFLKQADIARQRQASDDVLKIFQIALRQVPDDRRLRHGLAAAYVAKADRVSFKPFYQHALEEYWRLVNSDPKDAKAHEGLMTAAVKADQLAEVMEEYRARIARGAEAESYKEAFKKIQTLYFLKAEPVQNSGPSGGFVRTVFGRAAPILALVCLIVWVIVRQKMGLQPDSASPKLAAFAVLMGRTGIFSLVASLTYYSIRLFHSSK